MKISERISAVCERKEPLPGVGQFQERIVFFSKIRSGSPANKRACITAISDHTMIDDSHRIKSIKTIAPAIDNSRATKSGSTCGIVRLNHASGLLYSINCSYTYSIIASEARNVGVNQELMFGEKVRNTRGVFTDAVTFLIQHFRWKYCLYCVPT